MQVFQLGDELGFRLEAADEIGLVGELRLNDLYCDFPFDEMLPGKIDSTKGSFTNRLQEIVAFDGAGSVSVYIALLGRNLFLIKYRVRC